MDLLVVDTDKAPAGGRAGVACLAAGTARDAVVIDELCEEGGVDVCMLLDQVRIDQVAFKRKECTLMWV